MVKIIKEYLELRKFRKNLVAGTDVLVKRSRKEGKKMKVVILPLKLDKRVTVYHVDTGYELYKLNRIFPIK